MNRTGGEILHQSGEMNHRRIRAFSIVNYEQNRRNKLALVYKIT